MHYIPNPDLVGKGKNEDDKFKWYEPLKDIPVGSELYQVWAWSQHEECGGKYQ